MDIKILSKMPILMRLPENVVKEVHDLGAFTQVKAGTKLFQAGDSVDKVIWVMEGRIKAYVQEETVVDILSKRGMIGLAEVCENSTSTVSAETIEDCVLFEVSKENFEKLYEAHFDLQMLVFANLSAKMRNAVQEINDLKLKNTSRRLGAYLLGMAEQEEGAVDIELTFGKRLLAARLSMKPESLSRALAKLKAVGVQSERQKIHIKDIEILKEYCGEEEVML